MAVCKMEMMTVGLERVCPRGDPRCAIAKAQFVMVKTAVSQRKWPLIKSSIPRMAVQPRIRLRCSASSGSGDDGGSPKKDYDLNKVLEKVIHEEEKEIPADQKRNPTQSESGEASPFPPAEENTDKPFAEEEENIGKDNLIMPSKASASATSAPSSSIGEGLGASEQSALAADPVGGGSGKRDWRVYASQDDLDEIFENEGGNSVDDYKLRAHIFEESAVFFTALKNQESSRVV